ncbi:hypothetical protein OTU49_012275, partial [Cherax quadricarinatus]
VWSTGCNWCGCRRGYTVCSQLDCRTVNHTQGLEKRCIPYSKFRNTCGQKCRCSLRGTQYCSLGETCNTLFEVNGQPCEPGTYFMKDDCNWCYCMNGLVQCNNYKSTTTPATGCTTTAPWQEDACNWCGCRNNSAVCSESECSEGPVTCVPGSSYVDGCGALCHCLESGIPQCQAQDQCTECFFNGVVWSSRNDCNWCGCQNGVFQCSQLTCQGNQTVDCIPGSSFFDECFQYCTCPETGLRQCQTASCLTDLWMHAQPCDIGTFFTHDNKWCRCSDQGVECSKLQLLTSTERIGNSSELKVSSNDSRLTRSLDSDTQGLDSDTQGLDSDTRGLDSDTQGLESDTQGLDSDTQVLDSDTRGLDSDTRGLDSDTKGLDSDTQGLDSDTRGLDSDTQGLDSDTQGLDSDSQGLDSDTQGLDSDTQGLDSDTQGLDSDTQGLDSDTQGLDSDIQGLDRDTQGLDSDTQGLDSDTQGLDSDTQALDSDTRGLDSDTQGLDSDTQGLDSDTQGLDSDTQALDSDTRGLDSDTQGLDSDTQGLDSDRECNGTALWRRRDCNLCGCRNGTAVCTYLNCYDAQLVECIPESRFRDHCNRECHCSASGRIACSDGPCNAVMEVEGQRCDHAYFLMNKCIWCWCKDGHLTCNHDTCVASLQQVPATKRTPTDNSCT